MTWRCELCGERLEERSWTILRHTVRCFVLATIELLRLRKLGKVKT